MMSATRFVVMAALLPALAWIYPAGAQSTRKTEGTGLVQAQRNSIELKQGMSLADVQKLLGKPRRTALKDNSSGYSGAPSPANLRWTYVWATPTSSDNILNVEFIAKTPAEWFVASWEWTNY